MCHETLTNQELKTMKKANAWIFATAEVFPPHVCKPMQQCSSVACGVCSSAHHGVSTAAMQAATHQLIICALQTISYPSIILK